MSSPEVAHPPALAVSAEHQAFQELIESFVSAWNGHDMRALAAVWCEDGDLLNTRGHLAMGRAAVQRMLSEEHAGPMRDSVAQMALTGLRSLGPRVELVDAQMTLSHVRAPDGRMLAPLPLHVTIVARREPEGWRYLSARPYAFLSGF
jgi:uncharacterized protein (TIGR02246 family)